MTSSSKSSGKRKRRSKERASSVEVKCKFCGNTFMAPPEIAVCGKCGRPANRPLQLVWRLASLVLPPLGIGNSLWLRSHSPLASTQGLWFSLIGMIAYVVLYNVLH